MIGELLSVSLPVWKEARGSEFSGSIQVHHTKMCHLLPVVPSVPSPCWPQGGSSIKVEQCNTACGRGPVLKVQKGDPRLSPRPLPGLLELVTFHQVS